MGPPGGRTPCAPSSGPPLCKLLHYTTPVIPGQTSRQAEAGAGETAHPPHVDSVSCGATDGGGGGGGSTLTGTLDVAVATDKASYVIRELVHFFITVKDANGNPVEGAAVHVRIVTPNPITDRVGNFTTDEDGRVHTHYKVNAGRDGTGTYHVHVEVSKDEASGECLEANACHADFGVS